MKISFDGFELDITLWIFYTRIVPLQWFVFSYKNMHGGSCLKDELIVAQAKNKKK